MMNSMMRKFVLDRSFSDQKSAKKLNFLLSCILAIPEDAYARQVFEGWLVENERNYNSLEEKERRFKSFKHNMKVIKEHNSKPDQGYTLGLTSLADLTSEEFRSWCCGQGRSRVCTTCDEWASENCMNRD